MLVAASPGVTPVLRKFFLMKYMSSGGQIAPRCFLKKKKKVDKQINRKTADEFTAGRGKATGVSSF
jgi:hypothetical protein